MNSSKGILNNNAILPEAIRGLSFQELTKMLHYVDIETNKSGHFYLLGQQYDEHFQQFFLDQRFQGASKKTGIPIKNPNELIENFASCVTKNNGFIVAYSNAELDIFRRLPGANANPSLSDICYINLLSAAKNWIRRYKSSEFDSLPPFRRNVPSFQLKRMRYSLASVMRLTDLNAPADYAPGKTTSRFNTVAAALQMRQQNFSSLTNVQKAKMTKVLKHNLFDVKAMPILFKIIWETDPTCFKKAFFRF